MYKKIQALVILSFVVFHSFYITGNLSSNNSSFSTQSFLDSEWEF